MTSRDISEEEAVSAAEEILKEHRDISEEGYELSGVIDYTKFGKWRMIFDLDGEGSAVKIDIDRSGSLTDSNNLRS